MSKQTTIALLSQPNAVKSTLFNGLTGSKQHVGNWPGKTVEKRKGIFHIMEQAIRLSTFLVHIAFQQTPTRKS